MLNDVSAAVGILLILFGQFILWKVYRAAHGLPQRSWLAGLMGLVVCMGLGYAICLAEIFNGQSTDAVRLLLAQALLWGGVCIVLFALLLFRAVRGQRDALAWQHALTEAALDAVIVAGPDGLITDFNDHAEEVFGYKRDEILGRALGDMLVPLEQRRQHEAGLARLSAGEPPRIIGQRQQMPAQRRDGTVFPTELVVARVELEEGPVYVGSIRDISERIATGETLRMTQEVMDLAGDAVFWIRPDASIHYANNKACEWLGYSRDELLALRVTDFSPNIPDGGWALHWERLKSEQHITFQTVHRRKDDSEYPVEISINYFESGGQEFNCAFVRDITDRVKSEAALANAMAEAREADNARSEFLAVVSHEMRTPLNGILGSIELCLSEEDRSQEKELLRICERSGRYLKELIGDVLDYSQIHAGRFSLQPAPTNLQEVLGKIRLLFQPRANDKNLRFDWHVPESSLPLVWVDGRRLSQIVENLLSNAIKFTDAGFVSCKVTSTHSANTIELCIRVSDSGIGVEEADRYRIFRRFEQGSRGITRPPDGVGLGLSICDELARMMGGRIEVSEGPDGQGSSFAFCVRLDVSDDRRAAESGRERHQPRTDATLRGHRILFAEDDPASRIVATRMLEKVGVEVDAVADGMAAVERFAADPSGYSAVVLDVMMPGLDGLSAASRMRGLQRSQIPMLAMTAHASDQERETIRASDVDGYLMKPVTSQQLLSAVATLVDSAGSQAATVDLVNTDDLWERCDRDAALLAEVVSFFEASSAESLARLDEAIATASVEGASIALHRLKGSAANVCIASLATMCREWEDDLKNHPQSLPTKSLLELQKLVGDATDHLKQFGCDQQAGGK